MKRAAIIIAVLAAVGVGLFQWLGPTGTAASAAYTTAPAERGTLETVVAAVGTIEPVQSVEVGAQVSGQIIALHVAEGDVVQEGQLLAEIDTRVFEAAVEADRADLRALEAQRAQREAELTLARQQLVRQEQLMASRATSQEAYDSAVASVAVIEAQMAALEAEIAKAQSELEADLTNLSYARITAPMSGTVLSLSVRQGQTVNANQSAPVILTLADLEVMTVRAQVSEADVGKLVPGMEVYFTTLGDPDRRWTGTLRQILPQPTVENNVVLYNALFEVENLDGRLLPSMTAQVFFVVDRAADAVIVPLTALQTGRDGSTSVQVMAAGAPQLRPVTVGLRNRVSAAIVAGLEPGEQVVTGQGADTPPGSGGGRRGPFGF
jgi:macrolide-specific efflux system membrane fusion protein